MKGITLIGMPGAGKSTIGKMLAERLGHNFVDLDILIKEKEGRSHADILEQDGTETLLAAEEKHTLGLNLEKTVFAPGGSIVYSPRAMEKISGETILIYLSLPLSEIKRRLGKNIHSRGIVGLKEKGLASLFNERTPLYQNAAHFVIDSASLTDEAAVEKVLEFYAHRTTPIAL